MRTKNQDRILKMCLFEKLKSVDGNYYGLSLENLVMNE